MEYVNPLIPNQYNCTYVLFLVFKDKSSSKVNTDLNNS